MNLYHSCHRAERNLGMAQNKPFRLPRLRNAKETEMSETTVENIVKWKIYIGQTANLKLHRKTKNNPRKSLLLKN